MSQIWYMSYAGHAGAIHMQDQQQLDSVIRSLPTFAGWHDRHHYYAMGNRGRNVLAFCKEGLLVQLGDVNESCLTDLRTLLTFARPLGITMFGDEATPEDEMSDEDIERFLSPPTGPGS